MVIVGKLEGSGRIATSSLWHFGLDDFMQDLSGSDLKATSKPALIITKLPYPHRESEALK